jgi:hypothetical protein
MLSGVMARSRKNSFQAGIPQMMCGPTAKEIAKAWKNKPAYVYYFKFNRATGIQTPVTMKLRDFSVEAPVHGAHIAVRPGRESAGMLVGGYSAAFLKSGRTGCQRGRYGWGGATLSKKHFLSVVRAKLRAKVVAGRCPPKFNVAIAGTERLAAEHAVDGAAVHEIPAACEHLNLSTERKNTTRCCI